MRTVVIVLAGAVAILTAACDPLTAADGPEASADSATSSQWRVAANKDSSATVVVDTTGVIEGIVYRAGTRKGLAKATVKFQFSSGSAVTDASGKFRITGFESRKDVLVITRNGYWTRSTPIFVLPATGSLLLTATLAELPPPVLKGSCGFRPEPLLVVDGNSPVTAPLRRYDLAQPRIRSITLVDSREAMLIYGSNATSGADVVETTQVAR